MTKAAKPPKNSKNVKGCSGVKSLGIEAHEANADTTTFPVKRSQKDGLSRRCKACWSAYRRAVRAEKKQAKAAA